MLRNPPKEQKSGFDPIASIAYLEGDRTYLGEPNTSWVNIYPFPQPRNPVFPKIGFLRTPLGEPNTLWETYTRCWVPLHSTQPTTGERSHLPGGTQHAVGNIYPLLGSVALHPTYYWRAIAPTWGNPTRCGKHIPVVGFRCTPPNLLLESDRTYLGEPNTLWETYTRCWVPLHSTQPTTGERSHLPGGTQHAVGNIYPLLGSVALHPTYYWRAIAPTWGNPTRCGKHIPVVGFRCTPPNLLLESDRTYLGEPNTLWVNIYPYCPSTNSEICEDTQL
ncbi:hypothetical protein AmaxDRAFT_4825 [Limnospira maxima CS-328]|uniref:Uncharacterized protein n=1 Tax=Limnospira maxima CS-328 TaxID=513049 RepID=B5W7T8_LIMMA|nr:hypothetical protein AmaxDRAFT_4825 [Limnospira maxima CS-328]